jgi:hypothetical protein
MDAVVLVRDGDEFVDPRPARPQRDDRERREIARDGVEGLRSVPVPDRRLPGGRPPAPHVDEDRKLELRALAVQGVEPTIVGGEVEGGGCDVGRDERPVGGGVTEGACAAPAVVGTEAPDPPEPVGGGGDPSRDLLMRHGERPRPTPLAATERDQEPDRDPVGVHLRELGLRIAGSERSDGSGVDVTGIHRVISSRGTAGPAGPQSSSR